MHKFVAILLFIAAVASVQAQQLNNNITDIDEYLKENKQKYAKNIRDYDNRLKLFKQRYTASTKSILKRLDLLVDDIDYTEKRIYSLEIVGDLSRQCARKYRSKLPKTFKIEQQMQACYNVANGKNDFLIGLAYGIRASLYNYYLYTFKHNLKDCKFENDDYEACVKNAISDADAYTASNRKTFDSQMESSQIKAGDNVNNDFQCSYSIENRTKSTIAEINALIDDCKSCENIS